MIRTYKRKLILNKAQEARIRSWVGACRVVYNLSLEIKIAAYKCNGSSVNKYELMKQLTELRAETDWVEDVAVGCLQNSIEQLDRAYFNFLRNYSKGVGFPKFASKKTFKSISFKPGLVKLKNGKVSLPKIGIVKIFKDEEIIGDIKRAVIKIDPTGFFICLDCENVPKRFDSENQAVGLDMGLSFFCIDSNGNFINNPKHFKKHEDRLRVENRSLARKKKGSNSWVKQANKLALLHHKIANVRSDFLQKESTKIAKGNSVVYMEDLNISGMVKNKSLSKHILDCGWGMFKEMLSYKTTVVKVNPKYTSQTCSECGAVDSKSRISQSGFVCTSCGFISNADVNAAKNIKEKGILLDRQSEPIGCASVLKSQIRGMSDLIHETLTNKLKSN